MDIDKIIVGFFVAVSLGGLIFIGLWVIQTAFWYLGFNLTLWQVFIIWLASSLLFKSYNVK